MKSPPNVAADDADLVLRRDPFTCLPQDIRNQIYEYLSFPPVEDYYGDVTQGYSARNLALTCRQAQQEWEEERHRRFWVHLEKIKSLYLAEVGQSISYPQNLSSKHDLIDVRSLKVIIAGQIPIHRDSVARRAHERSQAVSMLLRLPLQALTFHFTDNSQPAYSCDQVKAFFLGMCNQVFIAGQNLQRITVSWNGQSKKSDVLLSGWQFELNDVDKQVVRGEFEYVDGAYISASRATKNSTKSHQTQSHELKISWPVINVAVSSDTNVGMMSMTTGLGAECEATLFGLTMLNLLFEQTNLVSKAGFEWLKTSDIEAVYETGIDE